MNSILGYCFFLYYNEIPQNQPVFLNFLFFEILKIFPIYWLGNEMKSDVWKEYTLILASYSGRKEK